MLIVEIKHDDCAGWSDWFVPPPAMTVREVLRSVRNVPTGADARVRRCGPTETDLRLKRSQHGFGD